MTVSIFCMPILCILKSIGPGCYVIPLGSSGELSAIICFSLAHVKSSTLVYPDPSNMRCSIDLYLCSGELECFFSCLGHIYQTWQFFIRGNNGAIVFSTWGAGTHMLCFLYNVSCILSYAFPFYVCS